MPKKILIFIFASLLKSNLFSQLTTNTSLTPTQLVENILIGQGVDVFNIKYTGATESIGEFNSMASNVGINQGLILSTGSVLDHQVSGSKNGPVGPNNTGSATTAWNTPGDASLTNIIGNFTYDAVALEFDFIPQEDTIIFNYVFASEEYIEFVGPGINDVFAFFISGPGFSTPKNIAILPGTNTPISINNVNNIINNAFFINNGDGFSGPQYTDPTVINFDGMTVKLTAMAKVAPCKTYHLKIVLADGGDAALDSGVFLEAGSLNSFPIVNCESEIILEIPNVFTPNNDGINDFFVPITSLGINSINTKIFNRWSNKVYETNDPLIKWDAQDVSNGTYFWVIHYTDINGTKNILNGHVSILN